jgi:hypothetical protein
MTVMGMRLKTKKNEVWITEEDDLGGKARFLVSPMTPKEELELLDKCKEREWDRNQRFESPNLYQFRISKIRKVILDWEGVEDEDGKPIEYNKFNVELVYLHNSDLIDKVLAQTDALGKEKELEQEEQAKNLKAGPNGPAKKGE